jgi:hypothetical protein
MSSNTPSGSRRESPTDRRSTQAVQQAVGGGLSTDLLVRALFDIGTKSRVPPPGSDIPEPHPAPSVDRDASDTTTPGSTSGQDSEPSESEGDDEDATQQNGPDSSASASSSSVAKQRAAKVKTARKQAAERRAAKVKAAKQAAKQRASGSGSDSGGSGGATGSSRGSSGSGSGGAGSGGSTAADAGGASADSSGGSGGDAGSATDLVLQAEDATLNNATTTNKGKGYTGTGYVVYEQASGADIQWTVDLPAAGPYALGVRYASEDDLTMELRVNGDLVVEAFAFPATGGPIEWDTVETEVQLSEGENRVRLISVEGGPHVDRLEVSGGD